MAVIIFKPSEKCNSNCVYCDVIVNKDMQIKMPFPILEDVFIKINEFLISKPHEKMQLVWHGGEPCLLGVEYFEKAIEIQDKHCPTTKNRIEHAVQSNLTIITQQYIDVFKKLGIRSIGTSFEPIPNMRGFGATRDSLRYNKQFFKGTNLLNENNIGWGFIYVVTKRALERPLEIFNYLVNLRLRGGFMFNPVLIYRDDNHNLAITPEEFADFLGTIFPTWWKFRKRYPEVNPFRSYVENIISNKRSLGCEFSGRCAYHWAYIGPSGEVSHCGRAGDWNLIDYGNIKDRSLIEIFNDPQRDNLIKRIEILPTGECADCNLWGICHGGCPLDSKHKYNDFEHKTKWCTSYKIFMEKYFTPITGVKPEFYYKAGENDYSKEDLKKISPQEFARLEEDKKRVK